MKKMVAWMVMFVVSGIMGLATLITNSVIFNAFNQKPTEEIVEPEMVIEEEEA